MIMNNEIEVRRATGNSTRLVDKYIQELFNNQDYFIKITDHFNNFKSNKYLVERILKRMHNEHPHNIIKYKSPNYLMIQSNDDIKYNKDIAYKLYELGFKKQGVSPYEDSIHIKKNDCNVFLFDGNLVIIELLNYVYFRGLIKDVTTFQIIMNSIEGGIK